LRLIVRQPKILDFQHSEDLRMRQLFNAVVVGASLFLATPSFAQERANPQAPAEIKPADSVTPLATPPVRLLNTNCYTNQQNCAGVAWFYGNSPQGVSCSVYFNNGAGGQSNFVIPSGQDHGIHVQYGDTKACVFGTNGVPNGTGREWIFVK
jgi:hypothetical protein